MTPEQELQLRFDKKMGMFDSFSADQASDIEPGNDDTVSDVHWACGKSDCTCDEDTDRAMDNDMRDEEEQNETN